MRTDEIVIRDPYVLVHGGKYYLYGTRSATCWGPAEGFDCYISEDLQNWEGPVEVFHAPEGFFADHAFWAPECYAHQGGFYLLTTFGGKGMKKGIYVLRSDRPEGPYRLHGSRLTRSDWTCIDGTLYFENGRVFLIYSHSFEDTPDADICVQELSGDLTAAVTEPVTLFLAKDAPWAKPVPFAKAEFGMDGEVYFSDGPSVFPMEDGNLYMTWSSWSNGSYAVGVAVSESGTVMGPWRQLAEPIWPENGGHGMSFVTREGERRFVLHYPNDKEREHPCFRRLALQEGRPVLLPVE